MCIQNQGVTDAKPLKLIRIKDVCDLTGLSRSYVYELSSRGQFPTSINLVPGGSSKAWIESEVTEWIQSRISQRGEQFND